MDSPSPSSFSWATRQVASSHSPEDVTNGMLLLSLRERLDSSIPLPNPSLSPVSTLTRETTPYPPSSLSPHPLPQVYQVPQHRQAPLTDGSSHLTSPPTTPSSPTSITPSKKVLSRSLKENYRLYSRQRAQPRDPKMRMRLKVIRMFQDLSDEFGLLEAQRTFEDVLDRYGVEMQHDMLGCQDCQWEGGCNLL